MKIIQHSATALCAAFLLSLLSGCQKTPDIPPLQFAKTEIDVGMFESNRKIDVPFEFTAWEHSPVTVKLIDTFKCGGTGASKKLEGTTLKPGETGKIDLFIPDSRTEQRAVITAIIETDPPSPEPIQLTLKGIRMIKPRLSVSRIDKTQEVGKELVVPLVLSRLRSQDIKPLEIDLASAEHDDYSIDVVENNSIPQGHPTLVKKRFSDNIKVNITFPARSQIQKHKFDVVIPWKENALHNAVIPVELDITHPIETELSHLHSTSSANEKMNFKLPVKSSYINELDINSTHNEFKELKCVLTPDKKFLDISCVTPDSPGRHECFITLKLSDKEYEPKVITISTIVQ